MTAVVRAAALVSLLAPPSVVLGGAAPIHFGAEVEIDPSVVRLDDGSYLAGFTRISLQGRKVLSDLYLARAASLQDAMGGIWSVPTPLPLDAPSARESAASMVITPSRLIGLFYTSDATGVDRIYLTTSPQPGSNFNVPGAPLVLGQPAGTATRWPAAMSRGGGLILVYEAEGSGGPGIYLNTSATGITWGAPVAVAASGRRPAVALLPTGVIVVAFEDGAGAIRATTSPSGAAGTWSAPVTLSFPAGAREAAALVYWDGRGSVYASVTDGSGFWGIQRVFLGSEGTWGTPEPLVDFFAGVVTGDPAPLVVETGVLCMGFDGRSQDATPPSEAHAYFACMTDFSCTEPPTFGGLSQVRDPDPCRTGELDLEWLPPSDYGSATVPGARYYVYRDTAPGFLPTPANRIAGPLTQTTWVDTTVTPGVRYYYIVRAENLEDCPVGNGPAGGMMDTNTVRIAGTDAVPQPPGGTVRRLRVLPPATGDGPLRLSWEAAAGAATYRLYRLDGEAFQPGGMQLDLDGLSGTATETAPGQDKMAFFVVRPVSECGIEGDD